MDVRFCEGRDQRREAPLRAEDLDQEERALASAPGHVCFSLTEDLHGCRSGEVCRQNEPPVEIVCQL